MKKIYFILLSFYSIAFFSQSKYDKEIDYLRRNCNQEALDKAKRMYSELQAIQMDNSFDTTLKDYYEFLESTKCRKFDLILFSVWERDKMINERIFKSFFYNSDENYNIFINGYIQKKRFIFVNSESLDQGIDNELQLKMLKYVESRSKNDLKEVISSNIEKLNGQELTHFISTVDNAFGLKEFQKELINKSYHAEYPFDLDFLLSKLIYLKVNNSTVENILNNKKNIWDKGNWSEKFWSLIKSQGFNINADLSYTIDDQGKKKYNIKEYIKNQQINNMIGENPLLFINHSLVNYNENSLIEMLEKLDIKDIQSESKDNSVSLYGARGIQGTLMILTN